MPESTLAVELNELQLEVGFFLGYGPDSAVWDDDQLAVIDRCIKSGYHQFLHPPVLPGEAFSYDWSFMRPVANILAAQGVSSVLLPDDYAGCEGLVTVLAATATSQPWRIEWRTSDQIRQWYSATPIVSGPPRFVAEDVLKGTTVAQGTRSQLLIFPTTDQAYTLQVRYYFTPDTMSTEYPFPYGGSQHGETIKAACIAAAELYLDDTPGPRNAYFKERLAASISIDRRKKPQKLGPNLDRSDDAAWDRNMRHYWGPAVTYNGSSMG